MNPEKITVTCFAASYGVALLIEAFNLVRQAGWRRVFAIGFATAGLAAHGIYLVVRGIGQEAPWASPADWYLIASLVLATLYLAGHLRAPRWATGPFLLPLVLVMIGASLGASNKPFSVQRASAFWGPAHGGLLMLATLAVIVGFLAGLMYLIQSWRLKQKLLSSNEFRLPSLELLEKTNASALAISTILVAGGFVSGLFLQRVKTGSIDWASPVTLSLAAMLAWLLVAEAFRVLYPAARRGRKVAYLTLASFGFLVLVLVSVTAIDLKHADGPAPPAAEASP